MNINFQTKIKKRVKQRFGYRQLDKIKDFSFALPALLFLAIFTYYPLLYSAYLSFTDWNMIRPEKNFVGLDNYTKLFSDETFYHVLKVTFYYTVLDVVFTLVLGLALALLLNVTARSYAIMRMFIFMPHYISMIISSMIFIWILNANYGVLNKLLALFGISPIQWLNNPKTALLGVVMVSVWKGVGFAMIIFLAGLRSIPKDYYEASDMDGASKFQQFIYITLPLLSPITLFLVVTSFISSMQVFQSVDVMTGGGPLQSTLVMVMWIYQVAFDQFKIGQSSAIVIVFFTIIVSLTILQFVISKKKVHYER